MPYDRDNQHRGMSHVKHYLWRHRPEILTYTGMMVIMELLTVYGAVLNADMLNALIKGRLRLFLMTVGGLLVTWALIVAIQYWGNVYQEKAIQNIDRSIRADLADLLVAKDYETYNGQSTGVYESWLNNDIQTINDQGLRIFFSIIPAVFGTAFAVITLVTYHWSLAVSAVILAALIIVTPKVFDRGVAQANRQLTHTNEAFVRQTQDVLDQFNLLYTFQALHRLKTVILTATGALKRAYVGRARAQTKLMATGFMGNVFSQVLLIGLSGWLALQKLVSIGTLSAVGALSGNIFNNLGQLTSNLGMMRGVQPIFDKFEAERRRIPAAPSTTDTPRVGDAGLVARDVGFAFPQQPAVFQHVTCQFTRGHKYLILGASGSGKSTFLRILAGYYQGYTGHVLLAHRDLRTYAIAERATQILYLDQRPQAIAGTVRDNLLLDDRYSQAELIAVLRQVKLVTTDQAGASFLDQPVGQAGAALSGGQLQRVALARGLLRHVQTLLLDEGTSAVDPATAVAIERLLLTMPRLTLVMVSHTPHAETEPLFDQVWHFDQLSQPD